MGIDPGIAHTGYAIVENHGQNLSLEDLGIIVTSSKSPFLDRLKTIGSRLEDLINKHQPSEVAVEEIFFAANPKLALTLGHVRGVALYLAAKSQLPVFEYTPLQVKEAMVGYGRATKDQVRKMAKMLLHLKELDIHDDASDALAVAICHFHSSSFRSSWPQKQLEKQL